MAIDKQLEALRVAREAIDRIIREPKETLSDAKAVREMLRQAKVAREAIAKLSQQSECQDCGQNTAPDLIHTCSPQIRQPTHEECLRLLAQVKFQSCELRGVIIDVENGTGVDDACLSTIRRVYEVLAAIPGNMEYPGDEA